jgi:EAL domain-containing protein (putative c-di-GMP-specific phosphodiesterase class I)
MKCGSSNRGMLSSQGTSDRANSATHTSGGARAVADAVDASPTPYYQPIVSLPGGAVIGYEALARWPALGYPDPQLVFDLASNDIAVQEALDQRCITNAIDTFLASTTTTDALLFINTFPCCEFPCDAVDFRTEQLSKRRIQLVFELIEKHLLDSPRTLMKKVDAIRRRGWAIAFDDVGVSSAALPLLDVVEPEIVKLNVNLVRKAPRKYESQVMSAVLTYQQRKNAVIIAEGIESSSHYRRALAWGAMLGQGYRFGHPAPVTTIEPASTHDFAVPSAPRVERPHRLESPFDMLIAAGAQPHRALIATWRAHTRHVRIIASRPENPSILIVFLPDDDRFRLTPRSLQTLENIAAITPFAAVVGPNLPPSLAASGIYTVEIPASDPLSKEMFILALGPHAAAAVAIQDSERAELDGSDSALTYVGTYDRDHVAAIAGHILACI